MLKLREQKDIQTRWDRTNYELDDRKTLEGLLKKLFKLIMGKRSFRKPVESLDEDGALSTQGRKEGSWWIE